MLRRCGGFFVVQGSVVRGAFGCVGEIGLILDAGDYWLYWLTSLISAGIVSNEFLKDLFSYNNLICGFMYRTRNPINTLN